MFEFRFVKHLEVFFMLNVIALRRADKALSLDKPVEGLVTNKRSHVLKHLVQENPGRLYCGEESENNVPPLEIYAAR